MEVGTAHTMQRPLVWSKRANQNILFVRSDSLLSTCAPVARGMEITSTLRVAELFLAVPRPRLLNIHVSEEASNLKFILHKYIPHIIFNKL